MTRVRSGLHLVRIRKNDQGDELTVNGFEGENKEVTPRIAPPGEPARAPTVAEQRPVELKGAAPAPPPERVEGWLITGTQYGSSDASGRERKVRDGAGGREITAIVPHSEVERSGAIIGGDEAISSGALGVVRIDGKGRGFAGGAGLAIAKGRLETDLMVLKSDVIGGYI